MQGGGGDWAISLDKHDEEHGTEPKQRYEEEDSVHKYVCVCVCVCVCVWVCNELQVVWQFNTLPLCCNSIH